MKRVVILGAGPCGLTAAWELAKNGIQVTVIEKDNTVGGLCKTIRKGGYQFDLGGHRFISKDSSLINDITELMKGELFTRTRKSVIRFRDRQYDYPINFHDVMNRSSLWMNLKFAGGYFASLAGLNNNRGPKRSFQYWADKNFGKPLNDFFFKPYTEKLWGIPASNLSDDWAAQRISRLDAKSVIFKAIGLKKISSPRTFAGKYLYPKYGIGSIFERMSEEIKFLGSEILRKTEPVQFEIEGNRISSILVASGNNVKKELKADLFLSTIPLDKIVNLLGCKNVQSLNYRSLRFLNIQLKTKNLSPNTWMYVPESDFIMTRIQEPKRRSPFSAPEGKTSCMLEIPCERGDEIWNMEDGKLLERGLNDFKLLGFDVAGDVSGYFLTATEHAYPRYETGYLKRVNEMLGFADKFENFKTLGRQGLFRYIFMDTAMLMGRRWARSIIGGSSDDMENIDVEPTLIESQSVVE